MKRSQIAKYTVIVAKLIRNIVYGMETYIVPRHLVILTGIAESRNYIHRYKFLLFFRPEKYHFAYLLPFQSVLFV